MKKSAKSVSILLTLAMLATLLVPVVPPVSAAGLTVNYVDTVINVDDDADEAKFGKIIVKETNDFTDSISTDEDEPTNITFTLVDGVEFPADLEEEDFENMVDGSESLACQGFTSNSVTFEIIGTDDLDKLIVDFGELVIDSDFSGDVKVEIQSLDSSITSGVYVIGRVLGDDCTVEAVGKKDIAVGDTGVATGTLRITESAANTIDGGEITVTLPDDVEFCANDDGNFFTTGGTLKDVVLTETDDKSAVNKDDDELTIKLEGDADRDKRGFLDLTFYVKVAYDAKPGDLVVEIEGDSDNNIPDTDVILATIKDFGVGLSVKSVKEFYSGRVGEELDEIRIKSNATGSVAPNRYIVAELSGPAKFCYPNAAAVPCDGDMTCTDEDDNRLVWKISGDPDTEYMLKKLEIATRFLGNLEMPGNGEIVLKFSGNAGVTGEVVVARVIPAISVNVEKPTQLKIGVQGQPAGDVIVKEPAAGVLQEEDDSIPPAKIKGKLMITTIEGVSFGSRPTAEVIEGDLKLENDNKVYLEDINNDGLYDQAYVFVDKESRKASAVKFSNIKLNINRSYPEGPMYLKVTGSAVVDAGSAILFNSSFSVGVVGVAVTPAPQEEIGSGLFQVGSCIFEINGIMKMMDAAPYVKNGRTYVPLRYLAYACGLSDKDIVWEDSNQTVTLTRGNTVIKLAIGSKTMKVGDTETAMDVAPEINNGRTMLPARYVVEAFGGTVKWNNITQAVGIEF